MPTRSDNLAQWQQLGQDQQIYLQAIYEADQEAEMWQKKHSSELPGSEWRWLPWNRSYTGDLSMKLHHLSHSEEHARALLAELVSQGLIETREKADERSEHFYLTVHITKLGRVLVREALGLSGGTLSVHQKQFAEEVDQLGLASLQDAFTAFAQRDKKQIEAWQQVVWASRARKRDEEEESLRRGKVIDIVPCAWCSGSAEIKLSPDRRSTQPVREIHLHYDGRDYWVKQYGCSPACCEAIRTAKVTLALERDYEGESKP